MALLLLHRNKLFPYFLIIWFSIASQIAKKQAFSIAFIIFQEERYSNKKSAWWKVSSCRIIKIEWICLNIDCFIIGFHIFFFGKPFDHFFMQTVKFSEGGLKKWLESWSLRIWNLNLIVETKKCFLILLVVFRFDLFWIFGISKDFRKEWILLSFLLLLLGLVKCYLLHYMRIYLTAGEEIKAEFISWTPHCLFSNWLLTAIT